MEGDLTRNVDKIRWRTYHRKQKNLDFTALRIFFRGRDIKNAELNIIPYPRKLFAVYRC